MTFAEEIQPIIDYFSRNNYTVSEQWPDYVQLESNKAQFVFSKDPRDNAISIFVGPHELHDEIIEKIFKIKLEHDVSFSESLIQFFEGPGKSLLNGDQSVLENIKQVSDELAAAYTSEILLKQKINTLDSLWQTKDYSRFIKLMDQTDQESLPRHYQLRYNIAKKQLH